MQDPPTDVSPKWDPDTHIHPVSILGTSLLCNGTMGYSNALNWAVTLPHSLINHALAPTRVQHLTNVDSDQCNIAEVHDKELEIAFMTIIEFLKDGMKKSLKRETVKENE